MKKYCLPITILALLLLGCKKNEDITQVEVLEPAPTPLNEVALTGQVTDESGAPLSNVEIAVRYRTDVFTETTTDEEGFYEFEAGTLPATGSLLEFKKPAYFDNYRRVEPASETTVNVPLMAEGSQGLASSGLNPVDSMVLVQGNVLDQNGSPKEGVYVLLVAGTTFLGLGQTDATGTFAILTAKDQAMTLQAIGPCQQSAIGPVELPPIASDTTLNTFTATFGDDTPIAFSGTALDCNDQPINNGRAEFIYGPGELSRISFPLQPDGTFSFEIFRCALQEGAPLAVVVYNDENDQSGGVEFFYDGNTTVDLGNIEACGASGSSFTFTFEGETYTPDGDWMESYFEVPGRVFRQIGFSDPDTGILQLLFEYSEETGELQLYAFYHADYNGFSVTSQEDVGTVEVTELTVARISGTFSTSTAQGAPISGSFSIER
jgi:protocatechuate 3,4-dioxygenase beta subunit